MQDIFGENLPGYLAEGLIFVDFQFVPHLNNEFFPMINEKNIREASSPSDGRGLRPIDGKYIYCCDDNGAVSVENGAIKVVSEGVVLREIIEE